MSIARRLIHIAETLIWSIIAGLFLYSCLQMGLEQLSRDVLEESRNRPTTAEDHRHETE